MKSVFDAPAEWRFVASGRHAKQTGEDLLFVFQGDRLVVYREHSVPIPQVSHFQELADVLSCSHFLGLFLGKRCYSALIPEDICLPDGCVTIELRRFAMEFQDEHLFAMTVRAHQIIQWDHAHRFCSRCGTPTHDHSKDFAKVCPSCDYTQYPRLSPCIIVLVARGDNILLARGANFNRPMYSTLAGFVEPGETLEQAVHREVWEETGVMVSNLQYRGSQPWPFPHSLMVGFQADYAGGDIVIDPEEIAEADWFHLSELPTLPPHGSISRRLIEEYRAQRLAPTQRTI